MDVPEKAISARDVEIAYEILLGRPPESSVVVANHLERTATLRELRAKFMASQEYRAKMCEELGIDRQGHKPLDLPRLDIEIEVRPEVLSAMLRKVELNWSTLGKSEPYWSVLTDERFRTAIIGENINEFYMSGKHDVLSFTLAADRGGVDFRNLHRCFELGCGVGRLSVWLARIFPELIAADISAPHLRLAGGIIGRMGLKNVELHCINAVDQIAALPTFDCFISLIVLQHNPPPVIAFLLRTILRKLTPGGLAYFQVPTYQRGAAFKADEYLQNAAADGSMEMHCLPQAVVWQIADENDCRVVDVREDSHTGASDRISNSILLQKRAHL
jgi:SAM-dependent methyltransferase